MYTDVQNANSLTLPALQLLGAYRLFVPSAASAFAVLPQKPIHLGHVRVPVETSNITSKKIDTSVYGAALTVLEVVTKIEQGGTFESASSNDLLIRGLWAGSKAVPGTAPATPAFAPSTALPLNAYVLNAGRYYQVTTAGTTGASAPVFPTTTGATVTSGTVVFTDIGTVAPTNAQSAINNIHGTTTGMLLDVYTSAITGANSEIFVAPQCVLRGDGYSSGRDGANESTLKFSYTLLAPANYTLPPALGAFAQPVTGGYNVLNVVPGTENSVITSIITAFTG
jgi:hypothetical protein